MNDSPSRSPLLWLSQLGALVMKEFKQIIRDPSSYIVALFLPMMLLLFFGYALSLDAGVMRITILNEGDGPLSKELELAFRQSPHFKVIPVNSRNEASAMMSDSILQGILVLPSTFDAKLQANAPVSAQLIIDGLEPTTATFIHTHTEGILGNWQLTRIGGGKAMAMPISMEMTTWYNPSAKSRWFLVPGSITVVMTLIGTLLTSLVITREWERGTMEALYATPVTRMQIFLGKLIPYYVLGMFSMSICAVASSYLFHVPFNGSVFALFILSTVFLMPALGQGLLISSLLRSQLLAAIVGFLSGMMPAFMLSGMLFDINSMPVGLRYITYLIPARYFNVSLQTVFLAGDIWEVFLPSMVYMLVLAGLFFAGAYHNLIKRLDA